MGDFTFPEPESVELHVDGEKDKCSLGEDINFVFTGFSLNGKVIFLLIYLIPPNSFVINYCSALDNFGEQLSVLSERGILHHLMTKMGI